MYKELESARFYLKHIVQDDQAFIFAGLGDPRVIPFYAVHYDSFEATAAQIQFYTDIREDESGCHWKIVDKTNLQPVGVCGFNDRHPQFDKAEIGYWLLPQYWGKGIMQEVIPPMIDYLFNEVKLHRLEAIIEEGNEASCRLSEKLGFTYEGKLRECEVKKGKRISLLIYSLLATDKK